MFGRLHSLSLYWSPHRDGIGSMRAACCRTTMNASLASCSGWLTDRRRTTDQGTMIYGKYLIHFFHKFFSLDCSPNCIYDCVCRLEYDFPGHGFEPLHSCCSMPVLFASVPPPPSQARFADTKDSMISVTMKNQTIFPAHIHNRTHCESLLQNIIYNGT